MAVLLLSGCGKAPRQGEPGGEAPTVITIWHTLTTPEAAVLEEQLQQITANHPEIIVKTRQVREEDFAARAYQAEAGGAGPAIFLAPAAILRQLYAQGSLAAVLAAGEDVFTADGAQFQYGDKAYALPWLTDVPLIFYRNETALPPLSLEDILNGRIALAAFDTATLGAWWQGRGGRLLTAAAEPSLNAAENVDFLQSMTLARENRRIVIGSDPVGAFLSGEVSYIIMRAGQAEQISIPYAAAALSDVMGGQGQAVLAYTVGMANAAARTNADQAEAIRTLEEALLEPEVEAVMAKVCERTPANTKCYPSLSPSALERATARALANAWVLPGNPKLWELIALQDQAWADAFAEKASPRDALDQAQAQAWRSWNQ
jgi:multiple sugar transport system substrate-binding protein